VVRVRPFDRLRAGKCYRGIEDDGERKTDLVSGQEIWLGLGIAVRVAGMGGDGGLGGIAWWGGVPDASEASRFVDCVGRGSYRSADYDLFPQGGEAALAVGRMSGEGVF
jgi:hypothetical protein